MRQVLVLSLLSSMLCFGAFAQRPGRTGGSGNNVGGSNAPSDGAVDPEFRTRQSREPSTEEQRRAHEMEKERNKERQAALKRDADKLLSLATELKKYVDNTNEHVLSVDVVRRAEEIEKLAHSVKQKMKE